MSTYTFPTNNFNYYVNIINKSFFLLLFKKTRTTRIIDASIVNLKCTNLSVHFPTPLLKQLCNIFG